MPFWPFRHEVRVEWRDLDAAGHVNNAVYLSYMESARVAAYFALTGGARAHDLDIILARTSIDFRSAATMGETLVVTVTPGRVGETSFALSYVLTDKATGRVVAEAESVQVCYDYARQQKKKLAPEMRARLAP
ncbi:MAG TPA: thioesterase family protein [Candidatus Thermoplasmatota archaeon]|nr:thioesterase family protein [Candidatus Thermoplasmatota archaeon]